MSKQEWVMVRIAGLVTLEIGREAQRILKEQLGEGYNKRIAPFVVRIQFEQQAKQCDALDAAVSVGCELEKTGHFSLLVPAALAEVVGL